MLHYSRRTLLAIAGILALLPFAGILLTATLATVFQCDVNEATVEPCTAWGSDVSGFLSGLLLTGGLAQITIPIAMVLLVCWSIIEAWAWLRRRRRARKAANRERAS